MQGCIGTIFGDLCSLAVNEAGSEVALKDIDQSLSAASTDCFCLFDERLADDLSQIPYQVRVGLPHIESNVAQSRKGNWQDVFRNEMRLLGIHRLDYPVQLLQQRSLCSRVAVGTTVAQILPTDFT